MEIDERARSGSVSTPARPSLRYAERIVESLAAAPAPATAQEVFTDLRAHGERAGLATVYRALHALERRGAVHAIRRRDEIAYRACAAGRHDHLVCEACGAVEEIPRDRLEIWFEQVAPGRFPAAEPQQIGSVCARCAS